MEFVSREGIARGWQSRAPLSKRQEAGGPPHPIEVKDWGESLQRPDGTLRYPADVNVEQLERARRDPNCSG